VAGRARWLLPPPPPHLLLCFCPPAQLILAPPPPPPPPLPTQVLERKKELDTTKNNMDRLVDKLYVGRDRGLQLQVSINAAQEHQVGREGGRDGGLRAEEQVRHSLQGRLARARGGNGVCKGHSHS
jgi:hypothetical protein